MRLHMFAAAAALTLLPASLQAQEASARPPFAVEPHAGVFYYNPSTSGISLDNPGWLAGVRVAYGLGERTRLLATGSFAEVNELGRVGLESDYVVYGRDIIMVTGGAEYDVVPGPFSVSLALQAGAAWRNEEIEQQVGTPPSDALALGDYTTQAIIVPGIAARYALGNHVSLRFGLDHHIFLDDHPTFQNQSPALTFGFTIR